MHINYKIEERKISGLKNEEMNLKAREGT